MIRKPKKKNKSGTCDASNFSYRTTFKNKKRMKKIEIDITKLNGMKKKKYPFHNLKSRRAYKTKFTSISGGED